MSTNIPCLLTDHSWIYTYHHFLTTSQGYFTIQWQVSCLVLWQLCININLLTECIGRYKNTLFCKKSKDPSGSNFLSQITRWYRCYSKMVIAWSYKRQGVEFHGYHGLYIALKNFGKKAFCVDKSFWSLPTKSQFIQQIWKLCLWNFFYV